MSIHVALRHVTHYKYDRLITLGPQVVRLRPAPHSRTPIVSYSLKITPGDHFLNWQQDPQSNYLARLVFPEKAKEFRVEVDLVAEMSVYNPFDFFLEPAAEKFPFTYDPTLSHELESFQSKGPLTPKFAEFFANAKAAILKHPHTAVVEGMPVVMPHSEVPTDVHAKGPQLAPDEKDDKRPRTIDFLVLSLIHI